MKNDTRDIEEIVEEIADQYPEALRMRIRVDLMKFWHKGWDDKTYLAGKAEEENGS